MLRRIYVIPIKESASCESVEELIAILDAAPQYIPSMKWSRVAQELSMHPYELVWDHGFEDEDGLREYMTHPYHNNLIDHFMLQESPTSIVESTLMCFRFDDERVDLGRIVSAHARRIGGTDMKQEESRNEVLDSLEVTGETIYLLEQIDIVAGKTDEYLNALREGYVGAVAKRGMQLCASLRTLPGSGEEGLVLLWSIRGGWG